MPVRGKRYAADDGETKPALREKRPDLVQLAREIHAGIVPRAEGRSDVKLVMRN